MATTICSFGRVSISAFPPGLNCIEIRRRNLFPLRVLTTLRKAEYAELMILFFIQAAAMAIWFVPLGTILDAHGMHAIKPFAFATNALASFVSPLIFGAM